MFADLFGSNLRLSPGHLLFRYILSNISSAASRTDEHLASHFRDALETLLG
jgi:hypothetical protein